MKKKILIVEDESALSKVAKNRLETEGYIVQVADDGSDLLTQVMEDIPDLILLDLVMPKVDGFTVLKQLKSDTDLKKIPVIVLSNLSQETDVEEVKKLGAVEFLVKSDTPLSKVVEVVGQHLS